MDTKTASTSYVKRGRGYQMLAAYEVVNPDGDKMPPGRTVLVCPAHEEAPAWRAILAGVQQDGSALVVPLVGHFGEMRLRKLNNMQGVCLSRDEPNSGGSYSRGDECDWTEAKCLALSAALALDLNGTTF